MQSVKLIPLACLSRSLGNGAYQASIGGDGLYSLHPPLKLYLYKAKRNEPQNIFKLSTLGISSTTEGELWPILLLRFWRSNKKHIRIELEELDIQNTNTLSHLQRQEALSEALNEPRGLWLCALKEQLRSEFKEPFFFQILGLKVTSKGRKVAKVKDYFETRAHGILVLALNAKKGKDSQELMLPCLGEHVQWDESLDHIEVPHLESFLEAEGIRLS